MKIVKYISLLILMQVAVLQAQESILSAQEVNNIEDVLSLDPSILREEIVKLESELNNLTTEYNKQKEDYAELQKRISAYTKQENSSESSLFKANLLKKIVLSDLFSESLLVDKDYDEALVSIIYGDMLEAEIYLNKFLNKSIVIEDHLADAESVVGGFPEKTIALQNDVNGKVERANFLMGYVNFLLFKPKDALDYLAKSYNNTKSPQLIIYNLIMLVDSFYALGRTEELCFTIKTFNNVLNQVAKNQSINSDFIDQDVLKRISYIKQENNCQ